MLQEAIKTIQEISVEAAKAEQPRIVPIPGDPRRVFVDVTGTGGWEERRLPPGKRSHAVSTVEDLIRLALYAAGESVNADPAIWHDEDAVRLVFDQTDPWDCATVGLVKSPQWQMLETLAKRTPLRQREMVNLLRVELAGCLATPRLIGAVSHINFRAASHGSSSIEQGRDSFGSQVEREVAGVKEPIPETETVRLPLYQNVGERELKWDVDCDLEVNAAEQVFIFRPLPGQLEEAIALHQGDIRQRLQAALGDNVPVYAGCP